MWSPLMSLKTVNEIINSRSLDISEDESEVETSQVETIIKSCKPENDDEPPTSEMMSVLRKKLEEKEEEIHLLKLKNSELQTQITLLECDKKLLHIDMKNEKEKKERYQKAII